MAYQPIYSRRFVNCGLSIYQNKINQTFISCIINSTTVIVISIFTFIASITQHGCKIFFPCLFYHTIHFTTSCKLAVDDGYCRKFVTCGLSLHQNNINQSFTTCIINSTTVIVITILLLLPLLHNMEVKYFFLVYFII